MPEVVAKRLGYALKRAQHALRQAMDDALASAGLTMPQYAVMCALEAEPGMSNARLAKAAFVTAQSMQGVLANLESAGLVVRHPDPSHGRILRAELTARGRRTLSAAHGAVRVVETTMVDSLGAELSASLPAALSRCAEHLAALRDRP